MIEKGTCRCENCIYYKDGASGALNDCKKTYGVYIHSFGCGSFSTDPEDLEEDEN